MAMKPSQTQGHDTDMRQENLNGLDFDFEKPPKLIRALFCDVLCIRHTVELPHSCRTPAFWC